MGQLLKLHTNVKIFRCRIDQPTIPVIYIDNTEISIPGADCHIDQFGNFCEMSRSADIVDSLNQSAVNLAEVITVP